MGQPLVLTLLSQAGRRIFPSFGDGVLMVVVRVQGWICMLANFVVLISLQKTGICLYLHFDKNNGRFLGICFKNNLVVQ